MSARTRSERSLGWLVLPRPERMQKEKAGLAITLGVAIMVLLLCSAGNAGAQAPAGDQAQLRNAPVLLPVPGQNQWLQKQPRSLPRTRTSIPSSFFPTSVYVI